MKAKKLTPDQVEQMYAFTRQHFVEYYDLQTELTDHLAAGIEEQWAHQPDKNFENALQEEFKKFGVFGFMDVVEKRQAALTKKNTRLLWNTFRKFLGLPQALLSMGCGFAFFILLKNVPWLYNVLLVALLLVSMFRLCGLLKGIRRKLRKPAGNGFWKPLFLIVAALVYS